MKKPLAALALSLSLGLASAGAAHAADAPVRGQSLTAPQAQKVAKKAKRGVKRPRSTSRLDFTIGSSPVYGLLATGRGCTNASLQAGGWWYRWCGQDWRYVNKTTNVLVEYQHQFYANGRWQAYLSTWCRPYVSCVNLAPDLSQAYGFFYQ